MLTPLSGAAGVLLATHLLRKVYTKRLEQFAGFPQRLPSLLLGHLVTVDEFVKKQPPAVHADIAFTEIQEALGRLPVIFVNLRPAAEQLVQTSDRWAYAPPKAPEIWKQLEYPTGPGSIISVRDEVEDPAEEFELRNYATDLMFDIISRVVLDIDMDAQKQQPTKFMQVFRELTVTYSGEHLDSPVVVHAAHRMEALPIA
ncbi:hypothetical protein MGN70_008636 [Eutypa lata]|nr:hypothetical protein MGN70_008636 [Eutypa lata]